MKLESYLKINDLSQEEFAQLVNCANTTIHGIIVGTTKPKPDLALRIEQETNYQVSYQELVYDPEDGPIGLDELRANHPTRDRVTSKDAQTRSS